MTIHLNPISTAIVIAVIALLAFLAFKNGCNKPSIAIDQRQYDSVLLANKGLQKEVNIVDSLVSVNNQRSVREDSLAKVTKKLGDQLEVKSLTARSLAVQVKEYAKYKDTVQMLRDAPLLADEVIGLSEKLEEYKQANENVVILLDSTRKESYLLLEKKDELYKQLQDQFNFLAKSYDMQGIHLQEFMKKSSKRFGLGFHTGTTIISGKLTWIIGAGLNYNLIKF